MGNGRILLMFQAAYGLQPGTLELGQAGVQKLEVVETLHRRFIDMCYAQKARWTGSGARVMGKGMSLSRYKFFWQGCEDGNAGVGFLISAQLNSFIRQ